MMRWKLSVFAVFLLSILAEINFADDLNQAVTKEYDAHLDELFDHFHRNPELSLMEYKTADKLSRELVEAGFRVTQNLGGTGLIALLENGAGPLIMVRADMDGLPIEEKSGLANASRAKQVDWNGNEVFVMHACGHDVHITSLVGTARIMADKADQWSGTLMLLGQPAEERVMGARNMMRENLWGRFGKPDGALALHVSSEIPTGMLGVFDSPYSGADTVDVVVHGVGAHGASPHRSVDPVVLASQIVIALQTVVSRNLPPREPGVITVGSFHSGTKHNIISDRAILQITVRSETAESRDILLNGIRRIAENLGRAAGLSGNMLPSVIISEESVPPTWNDSEFTEKLVDLWGARFGKEVFVQGKRLGMGAEDFPLFTADPYIPSTYFVVGGTPKSAFEIEAQGGAPVPSHHSPLFKIDPRASIILGTEATVAALLALMKSQSP